jgi:transcriptional regulator with XRE-family HTH domain
MNSTQVNDINDAALAIGRAIRGMREKLELSPEDLTSSISRRRDGFKIAPMTLEAVEEGHTDTPLDHMLILLAAVGIDMRLPDSEPVPRAQLAKARFADIRRALRKARHPEGLRKISFKALSTASGIEQGQIGKIESGEAMPKFRTVLVLTRALGIDVRFVPLEDASPRTSTSSRASTLRRGRSQGRRAA